MRRQQLLQVAAIAVADEHALHAIHFAIERQAHLARVIKMPQAFIVAAPVLHIQKSPLVLEELRICLQVVSAFGRRRQWQAQCRKRPRGIDQLSGIDAAARMPVLPVVQIEGQREGREKHQGHPDQDAPLAPIVRARLPSCGPAASAPEIGHDIDHCQGQRQSEPLHRVADVAQWAEIPAAPSCARSRQARRRRAESGRWREPSGIPAATAPTPRASG